MVDDIPNLLEVRLVETLLNEMLFGCRNRKFDFFVDNEVIVNVFVFLYVWLYGIVCFYVKFVF